MLPNLRDFFVSYGSYHHNKVNKIIHFIFIPQIVFSLLCMAKHWSSTRFHFMGQELDYTFFFLLAVLLAYIKIDFISGVISSVVYLGLYYLSNIIWLQYKLAGQVDQHFKIFLIQHIVSWLVQFIGHGVFEKRSPALLDNILLTLVAPDFVILEFLFMFGYKKDVQEECYKRIVANIKAFHESKAKKAK